MQITVKLYAMLSEHLPPGAERNVGTLTVPEASTVSSVIKQLNVPLEMAHLVLINGTFVAPEVRSETVLREDDTLAIWPPVAGG
jgi:molybdopterin converting factor small subunit